MLQFNLNFLQMQWEFVQRLTGLVEANLSNENFGPDELAKEAGMSHSNLNRKLKSITNQNASQFIRETRLKKAKELLENDELTAAEISYRVGFGSPTYFNKCYREYFGVAPGEMRNHLQVKEHAELTQENDTIKSIRVKVLNTILVLLLVFVPAVYFFIKNRANENVEDKSIAVLPFKNMSNDTLNQYLADGMMDAILLNLSKIKDLRVISRTSVEQYRKSNKTAGVIGKKLDVAYLLEGSFQKADNQIRLIVQLIRTKDENHVWSDNYDRSWEDIFVVQSEVAEKIAGELKAVIKPEEKQLIRKVPTINLTAYDYYQRGKDLLENNPKKSDINEAQKFFKQSLDLDSTFALAYCGLATIYWIQNYSKTFFESFFLDSVLILTNKAIEYDDKCSEAYELRGRRYITLAKPDMALKELNKALELNPNNSMVYRMSGDIYRETKEDYIEAIHNFIESASRDRGKRLPAIFNDLGYTLWSAGFDELAKHYYQEKLKLDGDSIYYLSIFYLIEGNREKAVTQHRRAFAKDSNFLSLEYLHDCFATGCYEEAYRYTEKLVARIKRDNIVPTVFAHRIGYAYWKVGKKEEAEYYFNLQEKIGLESISKGRYQGSRMTVYYDLAAVYAFRGDKEKAFLYLEELYKKKVFGKWWTYFIREDPLFDNIRNEPRFQAIVKHIDIGFKAEHERVGKWLAEQGML